MKTDLEITQGIVGKDINVLAKELGIKENEVLAYGKEMAKIDLSLLDRLENEKDGKLILVTAITPTPAGEGKTTMSIGLSDGLKRIGKNVITALREPSLGPVLGMKGGATGGGLAQIIPRDKINLHFTGDLHAISTAHNFLSAAIDNHIYYNSDLNIDPARVVWPRTLDMNDRNIRNIQTDIRPDNFIITAASEIMAILALASSLENLRERLGNILVAYDKDGNEVYALNLKVIDSLVILLKEAIRPNLVQTLENTPVFVHGGPFANIAHGCNSLLATKMALKLGDYVVTEAGFGADLGAEKFIDVKTRFLGAHPDAAVLVATLRALKYHGFEDENKSGLEALKDGLVNIKRHTDNMKKYGIPYIIAMNHFYNDPEDEVKYFLEWAEKEGHPVSFVDSFALGSKGATDLAEKVVKLTEQKNNFKTIYNLEDNLYDKVEKIATTIYGATTVKYSKEAKEKIDLLRKNYDNLPVVIAKTPLSFSNSAKLRGSIYEFDLVISDARVSRGAGFVVVLTKGIITMPGLPEVPNAEKMFITSEGVIKGRL